MEYAIDVADACRERGLHPVAVTAGYICAEPRVEFYRHMDAANVDLKAFTEDFYKHVTVGHLQPVLDTLEYLRHETDVWFEITNLLIPGHNDSDDELDAMTAWIAEHLGPDVPLHFTAFHPDFKMLDVPHTPPAHADPRPGDRPPPRAALRVHRQRARHRRLEHVLPGLRTAGRRTRLVRARRVPPHRRRPLPVLRHADPRPLRRPAGHVGCPPPAGVAGRHGEVTWRARGDARRRPSPGSRRDGARCVPPPSPGASTRASRAAAAHRPRAARRRPVRRRAATSPPKAIIAPHAGYRYSGPVAATAYAAIAPRPGDRPPGDPRRPRPLLAGRRGRRVQRGGVRHTARSGHRRRRRSPAGARRSRRRRRRPGPRRRAQPGGPPPVRHRRARRRVRAAAPRRTVRRRCAGRRARRPVGRCRDRRRDQHRPQPLPRAARRHAGSTAARRR